MKKTALIIFIAVISMGGSAEKWTHEFTKDGISVYTKDVPGSPLRAFMAEGDVKASLESVNRILCDNPRQIEWVPDCIVSRDIMKISPDTVISYNETKAFAVNNRDVLVKTRIIKGRDRIVHEFTAVNRPDLVPEVPGKVRMKDMSGRWVLTPSGAGAHVIFEVRANPGGNIPVWLANSASRDVPYKTILGLRKMTEGK
jgi:hypothetical protein